MSADDLTSIATVLDGFVARWVGEVAERAPRAIARVGVERSPLPATIRKAVLRRDGYTCQWCSRRPRGGLLALEVDHILPWSSGGADHPVNLRALCQDCNQTRSNRVSPLDQRAHPIVTCCRRCDLGVAAWGDEIDAFCLKCGETGASPYVCARLIGGPTPASGLPTARPGLRDGSGVSLGQHPGAAAVRELLMPRLDAQAVPCSWCLAGVGEPCSGSRGPLVRSAAHPARLIAATEERVA